MRQVDFAKKSGLSEPVVHRLVHEDEPKVGRDTIHAVYEATDGAVTANDILGHDPVPETEGEGAAA